MGLVDCRHCAQSPILPNAKYGVMSPNPQWPRVRRLEEIAKEIAKANSTAAAAQSKSGSALESLETLKSHNARDADDNADDDVDEC